MIKSVQSPVFYLVSAIVCYINILHSVQSFEISASSDKQVHILRRNIKPVNLINWQWNCDPFQSKCKRFHEKIHARNDSFHYLEGCKSVCGTYGSIWPQPTGQSVIQHELKAFNIEDLAVKFDPKTTDQFLDEALTESWSIFSQYLALKASSIKLPSQNLPKVIQSKRAHVLVKISVKTKNLHMNLNTDESYDLTVNTRVQGEFPRDEIIVHVSANSYYGARHGLETLSQLITFDAIENCHRIPAKVLITDKPKYPYRGILLDTSRNFYSVASIKRIVDGLSYSKLNVLHWHINDQQSFPFVSERVPNLTSYGAYGPDQVYYKDEIKGLVMYARQRGVLLLPEMDAPSHAAYGWQFGPEADLGHLVTCFGQDWEDESGTLAAEPPAGQLNPVNENVYKILEDLYMDFIDAFTPMHSKESLSLFHMGGDEVNFKCWAKHAEIRDWLSNQGLETDLNFSSEGYLYLWSVFQEKAYKLLNKANKNKFQDGIILWTSELTKPSHISRFLDPSKYIIQVWTTGSDALIGELLKQKYRLIMSNYDAWYLDCGYDAWLYTGSGPENNWCSPYKGWKTMYKNNMQKILSSQGIDWSTYGKLIVGGEATMWSEQSDEFTVEPKLWPRGCAFAERLWTDPQETGWREAEQRLLEHRRRLVHERGLHADAMMPEFCRQNDGECYTLKKQAISFEDQMNERAFINEPFTLSPESQGVPSLKSHFFYQLLGIKTLIFLIFAACFIVRRRSIYLFIRNIKFMSIN